MTTLTYLQDTYQLNGTAQVTDILTVQDLEDTELKQILSKFPYAVVLDHTLFYPQGGGQPSDIGYIDGYEVKHVLLFKGVVYHLGNHLAEFSKDQKVEMKVDESTRMANARCHTGGHIIFSVVKDMDWLGVSERKGHHFADGAYVEFAGLFPDTETKESLQSRVDQVIKNDLPLTVTVDGTTRLVQVGPDFAQNPCGGTHLRRTGEVGGIVIKKLTKKKNQNFTKVSYNTV